MNEKKKFWKEKKKNLIVLWSRGTQNFFSFFFFGPWGPGPPWVCPFTCWCVLLTYNVYSLTCNVHKINWSLCLKCEMGEVYGWCTIINVRESMIYPRWVEVIYYMSGVFFFFFFLRNLYELNWSYVLYIHLKICITRYFKVNFYQSIAGLYAFSLFSSQL